MLKEVYVNLTEKDIIYRMKSDKSADKSLMGILDYDFPFDKVTIEELKINDIIKAEGYKLKNKKKRETLMKFRVDKIYTDDKGKIIKVLAISQR